MTTTFDVLARHKVIAEYKGTEHHPCRFRTALCPDRCGHARDVARFDVVNYESYEKLGEYGDDKQENFFFNLNPNAEEDKIAQEFIDKIKPLKVGQKVRLTVEHIYVKTDSAQYPERPIRALEIL